MFHNLENKTQSELIHLLIEELKQGNVDQFDLFVSLVKRALLLDLDKKKVEVMLQDLLAYCNKALEQKDGQAACLLGTLHHYGLNCPVSYEQANFYYDLAISYDNPAGMNNRAYMHKKGFGGRVDYEKAIVLYEKAIVRGVAAAMTNRAYMHQQGLGGEVDYPAAIALIQKAMKDTNSDISLYYFAKTLEKGLGCDADIEQAIAFYEKAIARTNPIAMHERALMHEKGIGGHVDYPKAIALYNQAIEYGYPPSFNNRAHLYENNPESDDDYLRARALYKQAIQIGSIMALTNLGFMHQRGRGGPVDLIEAARLYRRAAESENRSALNFLETRENPSIFNYHHAMSQKDFQRAAELMTDPAVLSEFILFDCDDWLSQKPQHFDAIKTVLGLAKIVIPKRPPENDIQVIKRRLLSTEYIAKIPKEYLKNIANMVTDMWHHDTQNREEIVRMLRQIIHGIAFFFPKEEASFSDLIEKTTVILGRKNVQNSSPTISFKQIKRFFSEAVIKHDRVAEGQQPVRSFS